MRQIVVIILILFGFIWGFTQLGDIFDEESSFLEPRDRNKKIGEVPQRQLISIDPNQENSQPVADTINSQLPSISSDNSLISNQEGFPEPTVQVIDGQFERTIHMGVRQYAWDPSEIRVKQGELVRLIVHNADVQHGLVIPELNVLNIDIPPEGAVIEFTASKKGSFVFFCSYYCGEGHSEMRGKIIVE